MLAGKTLAGTDCCLQLDVASDSRHWLTIDVDIFEGSQASKTIAVRLPGSLVGRTGFFEQNRLQLCLRCWLPACLQVQAMTGQPLHWRFSAADRGNRGALSMDGEEPELLIPDLYSFEASRQSIAVMEIDEFNRFSSQWLQRSPEMFWRGSSTGIKTQCPIREMGELVENDRIKVCARFRGQPGFNLAISRIVQVDPSLQKEAEQWMVAEHLLAPVVNEAEFGRYRYYPDLPGNGLAWGTIHKHLQGNLVFRPKGKRQLFYYRLLKPWKHFIPLREDLNDLPEAMDWANQHPHQACLIAWRGKLAIKGYLQRLDDILIDQLLSEAVSLL